MHFRALLLAAVIAGLSSVPSASARDRDGGGLFGTGDLMQPGNLIDRRGPRMTPGQAAKEAQRQYGGGKVLSVDPSGDGYRVKLLRDGDVRVVFIPDR